MQRSVWKIGIPLLLFGLLVLGFSVTSAFALSPLPVNYQPTPVVVQNNSSSSSTTSTTTQSSGTTTTQSGGTTTTGTTTTGTTTQTTSQSSSVVNNSAASPLTVSYNPTPVVVTPTTTSTTTTGTTGTTTTGTTTTTPSSSQVVVNNPASPLPVSYNPTPVVVTPTTTTGTTTTGTTGTTGTTTVQPEQPAPAGLTADEATLYDLINQDRADYGVNPVSVNMTAVQAATAKAQDMITNDYFGHDSPTYGMPSQMLTEFGVTYTTTGENIAEVANVEVANSDFMSDTGHKDNILNPAFTQVGVGVIPYNGYEVVVEEFIG